MPTQAEMKSVLQAYVDRMNAGDAQGVADLFADDARIDDPPGAPTKSKAEFAAFVQAGVGFGAKLALAAPIRGSHGNAAAMAFTVSYVEKGRRITVNSVDVMTFDPDGKIAAMTAYWGPDDIRVEDIG